MHHKFTGSGRVDLASEHTASSLLMPTVRIIKKYPNRRLYDTEISRYITLADVRSLVMQGVDLPTVSKLMGHSDIDTTMIYAHLAPDHLANAITKLPFSPEK